MPEAPSEQPFEAKLEKLEQVVKQLEAGDLSLEKSLQLFEEGMALSAACRQQLEAAEERIEILVRKNGAIQAEPFDPDRS